MPVDELILKALDKCLETAEEEQRRLFLWMKAALQYPDLERFIQEVRRAEIGQGPVSMESIHKAVAFVESYNALQIQNLSVSDELKDEMIRLEKIRLKEVEVRIAETLVYLGYRLI